MRGRYIMADGTKPTGDVLLGFKPPGKPQMLITSFQMIAGYFDAFYVDNAHFSYYMPKYNLFLFGPQDFNSTTSLSYNTGLMKIHVPSYYRTQSGSGVYSESGGNAVVGFFGPGASSISPQVCYLSNSGANITGIYTDVALSTLVTWNGSGAGQNSATQVLPVSGGLAVASLASCSGTEFHNLFKIQASTFSDGLYGVLGIEVPFKRPANSSAVTLTQSGSNLYLNWAYISPTELFATSVGGSTVDGIDAVEIRYLLNGKNLLNWATDDHAVDCNLLNILGFNLATPSNVTSETLTISGVSASDMSEIGIAYCPKSNGQYLLGQPIRYYSGGGGSPPTQLQVVFPAANSRRDACVPFTVNFLDASSNVAYPSSSIAVTLSTTAGSLYSMSNCTGAVTTENINSSGRTYYLLAPSTDVGNVTLSASASNLTTGSSIIYVSGVAANTDDVIVVGQTNFYETQCVPLLLVSVDSAGYITKNANVSGTNATYGSGGIGQLHSNESCSNAVGSGTMPYNSTTMAISFKPSNISTQTSGTLSFQIANPVGHNVTINPAGDPFQLYSYHTGLDPIIVDECFEIFVELKDNMFVLADNTSGGQTISISTDLSPSTDGQFFANSSDCGSGTSPTGTASIIYSGGESLKSVWFRRHTGDGVVNFTVSDNASILIPDEISATTQP